VILLNILDQFRFIPHLHLTTTSNIFYVPKENLYRKPLTYFLEPERKCGRMAFGIYVYYCMEFTVCRIFFLSIDYIFTSYISFSVFTHCRGVCCIFLCIKNNMYSLKIVICIQIMSCPFILQCCAPIPNTLFVLVHIFFFKRSILSCT
jgi:hypothetical protein